VGANHRKPCGTDGLHPPDTYAAIAVRATALVAFRDLPFPKTPLVFHAF